MLILALRIVGKSTWLLLNESVTSLAAHHINTPKYLKTDEKGGHMILLTGHYINFKLQI